MGEAKRRKTLGLPPKKINTKTKIAESPRLFEWLPFTIIQRDNLIKLSIKASWFGIGGLVILWIVVRFIGCLLYTSPSPRDTDLSRMPSSA